MARQLQKQEPAASGGQTPAFGQKADEAAALEDLVDKLVRVSNLKILFDRRQQRGIEALRKKYSDPEIVAAFRTFYDGLEEGNQFLLTHAPKSFIDVAGQIIGRYRREELAQQKIAAQVAAAEAQRCAERDAEFERIRLAEAEEAELMEDSLPT